MLKNIVIILIFLIILLNVKNNAQPVFSEKINININEDEIGITFIYDKINKMLLISDNKINILLILEYKNNKIINIYKYFNINKLDYIMSKNNIDINIKYKNKIILYEDIKIKKILLNPTKYGININYDNHLFNIIDGKKIDNKTIINGKFIYIYNFNKNKYIHLNNNIEVLFYNQGEFFSNRFLEHIYSMWLDTYMIQPHEYTTLKLGKNNFNMITIPIVD
jgi:hypothetical protein